MKLINKYKKNNSNFLIITRCSNKIGTGHLKRSLNLKKSLVQQNLNCEIWINNDIESKKIINNSIKFTNIKLLKNISFNYKNYIKFKVVIFDIAWNDPWLDQNNIQLIKLIEKLDSLKIRIINIGKPKLDTHSFRSFIDIYPDGSKLKVSGNVSPRFIALRSEFSEAKLKKYQKFEGTIFVTMGGTDPLNLLFKTLDQIAKCKFVKHINLLLGNNSKVDTNLTKNYLIKNNKTVTFLKNISAKKIIFFMKKSDLVVSAFGTSAFESMCLGVPVLAITHYKHQDNSAKWFADLNVIEYIGCAEKSIYWPLLKNKINSFYQNPNRAIKMGLKSNFYIDGKGNRRIVNLLKQIYDETLTNLDHLFIFAHPGTEALVASGTISKLVDSGKKVGIVVMGDGISSRINSSYKKNNISKLHTELEKTFESSCNALGVTVKYFFRYPDNQFDNVPLLSFIKNIEVILRRHSPNCIWTHLEAGLNIDHKIVHKAVMIASRPVSGTNISKVIGFKSPGSNDWSFSNLGLLEDNWFEEVDIKCHRRINSYNFYSKIKYFMHDIQSFQNINSQLKMNGKKIGVNAAESFYLIRNIRGVA